MVLKTKNICFVDGRGSAEVGQSALSRQDGYSNTNNHSLQMCCAERHTGITPGSVPVGILYINTLCVLYSVPPCAFAGNSGTPDRCEA